MRVALSFPGCHRRGGVERIVFECARYLASSQNHVDVFASEWETIPSPSIAYHRVKHPSQPAFLRPHGYFKACTKELRRHTYDVLNTHGCVCPTGGVHWVQSIHRAWLEVSRRFRPLLTVAGVRQKLNPLHPLLLALEARHFRRRDYRRVIATTQQVREDLKRIYGVPEQDVELIPNGFHPSEFSAARRFERRAGERERLGLANDEIALLFVANELERKGYPVLLKALKRLNRRDIRLLVVGRADAARARALASHAGVEDQVIFCGSTSDVQAYHAAADLFVLPTQYEAFCLAILEALGSGLPVITSTVPGAGDAIQPHINGLLLQDPLSAVELANSLEAIIEPENRMRMSQAAPDTVKQYHWPVVLQRYEAVLQKCCG